MKILEHPHKYSIEEVTAALQSNIINGLPTTEAEKRMEQFGPNKLEEYQKKPWWLILLRQLLSPLVGILFLAAILAMFYGDEVESWAIFIVIALNTGIGFFMEWHALYAMQALQNLAELTTSVIRSGNLKEIKVSNVVPGDLVFLEAGDIVPADARLVSQTNFGVDEALLTGESISVKKQLIPIASNGALTDRKNLLFKGTIVTRGNAKALITNTGDQTEIGRILRITQRASKSITPLEKKLDRLSHRLIWLTLGIALLIFIVGMLKGNDVYLVIETTIALAVAAIPEGLPVVATITLARGMLRLSRQRVLVKTLGAVETLGETQVILTDKTGTLTENRLTVTDLVLHTSHNEEIGIGQGKHLEYSPILELNQVSPFPTQRLLQVAALCNNAALGKETMGGTPVSTEAVGDPLELALLTFCLAEQQDFAPVKKDFPREAEIPFASETRMMGTLHRHPANNNYLVCIKGALEVVLAQSDYLLRADGELENIDDFWWLGVANDLARQGLRTLAFAYAVLEHPEADFFHNLIFVGLAGLQDPPRKDVSQALAACKSAGIKVVMATGDHLETARTIAIQTGLIDTLDVKVMHGKELLPYDKLSPDQVNEILRTHLFARVSPEQKLDIVS
ncbi:MAG: HAD-IC family P-type ATPase, partial [Bacteroidota bacterium]